MSFTGEIAGHPLLAERLRLQIMVAIASAMGPVDFNELLESLTMTKGNLSSHLRKLEDAGLIDVEKRFVDRRPRTSYRCTRQGRDALKLHLDELEKMILVLRTKAG